MKVNNFKNSFYEPTFFDDPSPEPKPDPAPDPKDQKPKFDAEQQKYIDSLLAQTRRGLTEKVNSLENSLRTFQGTAKERDELAAQLETVQASLRTAEEQKEHERQQNEKKFKNDLATIESERDNWKNLFTSTTVENSLLGAATDAEAYSPAQIVELLRGKTTLTDEIVDGKKTGKMVPLVKITLPDEKGNNVELTLSPKDAVKRMKETTNLYGNLFKNVSFGGIGLRNDNAGKMSLAEVAKNPELYRKMRKDGTLPLA